MFGLPWIHSYLKPKAFHPYTSSVRNRIFEVRCETKELQDEYKHFEKELLDHFDREGIRCAIDNKIVFEFVYSNTQKVCYGFYDWVFSIGMDYYDENEKRR